MHAGFDHCARVVPQAAPSLLKYSRQQFKVVLLLMELLSTSIWMLGLGLSGCACSWIDPSSQVPALWQSARWHNPEYWYGDAIQGQYRLPQIIGALGLRGYVQMVARRSWRAHKWSMRRATAIRSQPCDAALKRAHAFMPKHH